MAGSEMTRRRFLRNTVLTAAALPASVALLGPRARAAEKLKPSDPQAQALQYTEDASSASSPSYQPGQQCNNCQFFQGSKQDQWGPCTIFGGKLVSAKGWCTSYSPMG